jgi:hypothetical protein
MTYQGGKVETAQIDSAFSDDKLRFLWVTDSHVQGVQDSRDDNLRLACRDCNQWRPEALIHTGDIGDNDIERVQRSFNILKLAKRPVYTIIGNHDEDETDGGAGNPNTSEVIAATAFNRNPLYYATVLKTADESGSFLCLFLDCNYYDDDPDASPPGDSANHDPGDRIGYLAGAPSGGYFRMFTQAQLDWVETTLAADSSDAVLVFVHYPPAGTTCTDYVDLLDLLQADGRDAVGFCGHVHPDATSYTQDSTDTNYTLTVYKCPAILESGSWTRMTLSLSGGSISVDELLIQNYTDPGGWTINAPFTT